MISVEEARTRLLALCQPLPTETIALRHAAGRYMSAPVTAARDQPPFPAAAMDGYAVAGDPSAGTTFRVVGEAGAGHRFDGTVEPSTALRIFTGAPIPAGATRVIIQEDVDRTGDTVTLRPGADAATHIRPAGQDFTADTTFAPRRLRPHDLALLGAMNAPQVAVARRPVVAIIPTGDELVMPGEAPRPDQIFASNSFAIAALAEQAGAEVRMLPIARDTVPALTTCLSLAEGADVIVTI
ncbi:MAG: molybdopterin molybdotransferase MoeA, partial [Paracoccaceae bacterium]